MAKTSPGFKLYNVPGSTVQLPGYLIKHRGAAVDDAVDASLAALVTANKFKTTSIIDVAGDPVINPEYSDKVLVIKPVDKLSNKNIDGDLKYSSNQFEFVKIDNQFINKPDTENYSDLSLWSTITFARNLQLGLVKEHKPGIAVIDNPYYRNPSDNPDWTEAQKDAYNSYVHPEIAVPTAIPKDAAVGDNLVLLTTNETQAVNFRIPDASQATGFSNVSDQMYVPKYGKVSHDHVTDEVKDALDLARKYLQGAKSLEGDGPKEYTVLIAGKMQDIPEGDKRLEDATPTTQAPQISYSKINHRYLDDIVYNVIINANGADDIRFENPEYLPDSDTSDKSYIDSYFIATNS